MKKRNQRRIAILLFTLAVIATITMWGRSHSLRETFLVDLAPVYNGHFWIESAMGKLDLRGIGFGNLTRTWAGDQRFRYDRSVIASGQPHPVIILGVYVFSRGFTLHYAWILLGEILIIGLVSGPVSRWIKSLSRPPSISGSPSRGKARRQSRGGKTLSSAAGRRRRPSNPKSARRG